MFPKFSEPAFFYYQLTGLHIKRVLIPTQGYLGRGPRFFAVVLFVAPPPLFCQLAYTVGMLYLLHRDKNDYERDKKGAAIAGERKGVEKN
jgi:hypothetical protein